MAIKNIWNDVYKHSIILGSVFNEYQVPSTIASPQCALVTQSCPTLCGLMDCSPPSSSVHGTLQARILEWVAMPFCRGSSQPRHWTQVSCIGRWILYRLSHQRRSHNTALKLENTKHWSVLKAMTYKSHSMRSNHAWLFVTHGLYSPWNSPGQNTGSGSHSLLQRIFPAQGSNPGVPHCRWILYQLSHKGSTFNEKLHIKWVFRSGKYQVTGKCTFSIPYPQVLRLWIQPTADWKYY